MFIPSVEMHIKAPNIVDTTNFAGAKKKAAPFADWNCWLILGDGESLLEKRSIHMHQINKQKCYKNMIEIRMSNGKICKHSISLRRNEMKYLVVFRSILHSNYLHAKSNKIEHQQQRTEHALNECHNSWMAQTARPVLRKLGHFQNYEFRIRKVFAQYYVKPLIKLPDNQIIAENWTTTTTRKTTMVTATAMVTAIWIGKWLKCFCAPHTKHQLFISVLC